MLKLARVNDAEAIDIPMDRITDLVDPPVHIFAQAGFAPCKFGSRFRHIIGERVAVFLFDYSILAEDY